MASNIVSQTQIIQSALGLACIDNPMLFLNSPQRKRITDIINRTLSESAEPPHSFLNMPKDVLGTIFQYLTIRDISACSQICKNETLNAFMKSRLIWEPIYERHFQPYCPEKILPSDYFQACKELAEKRHLFRSNVSKSVGSWNILKSTSDSPAYLTAFKGKLYTSSYDEVRIFSQSANRLLRVGEHHCITVCDDRLYTGCKNKIKVWDINTGACLNTFEGYEDRVIRLSTFDKRLYAGCGNKILILDPHTGECLQTLYEHEREVSSLDVFGDAIYAGFLDGTILVQGSKSEESTVIKGHSGAILSLAVSGKKLCSSSYDETLRIWDVESRECLAVFQGKFQHLAIVGEVLFSSPWSTKMTAWDINEQKCLGTFSAHHATASLASTGTELFSSYRDGIVKSWDFTANNREIFTQLTHLFRSNNRFTIEEGMQLFSKMPRKERNKIYHELYFILCPFSNDYFGCGEDAFHGRHGQSSTPDERAEAVENYLSVRE